MRNTLTIIVTLAVCATLTYFLWDNESHHIEEEEIEHHHDFIAFSDEQLNRYNIITQPTSSGSLQTIIRAPTLIIINPNQIAHVLPKVTGIAIKAYKNLGEEVHEGDILATLESREIAEAKAAYLTALKKEQLTTNTLSREKNLHEQHISSTLDYKTAENAWDEAHINLELCEQKLYALGLDTHDLQLLQNTPKNQLREYAVRSPISGTVIERHITPGEGITDDHEIYTIANLSTVWAEISVFSQDRPYIKKGQTITLSTSNGNRIQARVLHASPIIDQDTRTSTVIAEIDNQSHHWLPGTFAQAELIANTTPVALVVPKEAVQNIEGIDTVFVATQEGFAVRPITTGKCDETHYEVLDGLNHGETYACKNTFLLKAELQKDEAEHMD